MSAFLTKALLLFSLLPFPCAHADQPIDSGAIVKKMEASYAAINDYRTFVEVRSYKTNFQAGKHNAGALSEADDFTYTFKKPDHIRIDFVSPHSGWIVIYPDKEGKALVRSSGSKHFLELHLSTRSRLLTGSSNQRVDQTDFGLLIKNIAHSVSDKSKGPVSISRSGGIIEIGVLSDDHFREGVETMYRFLIDEKSWLPIAVDESTPDGRLKRTSRFKQTEINIGVTDSIFELEK